MAQPSRSPVLPSLFLVLAVALTLLACAPAASATRKVNPGKGSKPHCHRSRPNSQKALPPVAPFFISAPPPLEYRPTVIHNYFATFKREAFPKISGLIIVVDNMGSVDLHIGFNVTLAKPPAARVEIKNAVFVNKGSGKTVVGIPVTCETSEAESLACSAAGTGFVPPAREKAGHALLDASVFYDAPGSFYFSVDVNRKKVQADVVPVDARSPGFD